MGKLQRLSDLISYFALGDDMMDEEEFEISEPAHANTHPDEMDVFEDAEEEEVNDELRRLGELTEIAHHSDGDDDDNEEQEIEENDQENDHAAKADAIKALEDEINNIMSMVADWSWDLTRGQRIAAAAKFLRLACAVFKKLNKKSEAHLVAARKHRAEAGAQAFRSARIVGATVVGASRRLEAIRAAEPFAVVVEEACEVIEPTLMSVLAVNTLRKLELIGDHRQLPAFVQQCWYNFETTMPSIKTSLFERLISGKVKGKGDIYLYAGNLLFG